MRGPEGRESAYQGALRRLARRDHTEAEIRTALVKSHPEPEVEEAMRRVGDGAPLTDVALDLGFSAPGNFSRFFKEHTGVSPSIFRRAVRTPMPSTVTGVPR